MDILLRKVGNSLVFTPERDEDTEALKGSGELILVDYKKRRNPGNHRRYFAFIKTTFDMQEDLDNQDTWRKYLQMRAGHYDAVVTPNGKTLYWPRSIEWAALDEAEFDRLFNQVVQAFLDYYGMKLTPQQLDHIAGF